MRNQLWIQLARGAGIAVVAVMGFWNIYSASAQAEYTVDYILASQKIDVVTQPGAIVSVIVPIKNVSEIGWDNTQIQLGTIFSTGEKDRPSAWSTSQWLSETRIGLRDTTTWVGAGNVATFNFTIKAPARAGWYREYLQPVINNYWLPGDPIVIQIQVGDGVEIQSTVDKEIRIYRNAQQGELIEHGYIVATLPISSGRAGYTTPAGKYTIYNHIANAYSSKYALWMPNWMGLSNERTGFVGYGMHSLPYWKVSSSKYTEGEIYPGGRLYTQGRLYEGYSHLGRAVSHGCVRWGIRESGVIYNWAPNGTPVQVV
ncbi:MAG: L,D-transpeptidase [Patescibacteria group bacterium]|jgi:lipoprotein-anchoring transpeptidase ErfK/SrfK